MIRRPPRSTQGVSSAASDVYKRQVSTQSTWGVQEKLQVMKKVEDQVKLIKQIVDFFMAQTRDLLMGLVVEEEMEIDNSGKLYRRSQLSAHLLGLNKEKIMNKEKKLENYKVAFASNDGNQIMMNILEIQTIIILSLIHISEPTRPLYISYAVFCLKKKKKKKIK
eukprot:TRINITY_DN28764_c0_g1_i1.p1 TRINITY_DN28764_c0_g1~~TRINITY_DN28764_c0_g1_i1.p1  ORF type:complete len:165 (-),score=49.31 TRINITY_DN28764_c0_g1_i1:46-540(-)